MRWTILKGRQTIKRVADLFGMGALVVFVLILFAEPAVGELTFTEEFESGFTAASDVGEHPDWFDGSDDNSSQITAGIGCGGSNGLAPGMSIFTWTAHPFDWNYPSFLGIIFQMDFETDDSGNFADDRIGWMVTDSDTDSSSFFGFQLDPDYGSGLNIEGHWEDETSDDRRPSIADLTNLTKPDTWYRLCAEITKLTATSAKIEVTLTELDTSGYPVAVVAAGSIDDTSLLGDDAPDAKYFTAEKLWPAYKNSWNTDGAADNASFGIIEKFAFVVISDIRPRKYRTGVEEDMPQIADWINNPTHDMPAPEFMVITGDFDHTTDTEEIVDDFLGEDFTWFPVIGNHEFDSNNIYDLEYVRDTMVPSLPGIVNDGPPGSVGTSYSWEYGNAHFVSVNCYWDGTNDVGADHATDGDIPGELHDWIDADLPLSDKTHRF